MSNILAIPNQSFAYIFERICLTILLFVSAPESPAAGYMVMSPGIGPSRATAPIPIHPPKESMGYMDMMASGLTSQTQTLPTVKESGSESYFATFRALDLLRYVFKNN